MQRKEACALIRLVVCVWHLLAPLCPASPSLDGGTRDGHDARSQMVEVADPMRAVTNTHHDNAGRKWKVEAPAPEAGGARPATVTTFDPGGLALTVTNALNQTVTNTYDGLGRLVTTVDAENITNSFEYDAGGNRTKVTDGLNQATTFVYDGGNRLVRQRFANGDEWAYAYNPVHKVAQRSPRGIVTNFTYDARDRLMTVTAPADREVAAVNRSYTYDNAGKLLTVTEAGNAAANVSNVYDAMGRLVSESSRGQTHQYQYDLAGSRTQASYSTGRVVSTTYDALGRPKTISEGGRTTTYGYDLAGRALLLVSGNGQTSLNDYDALGRLKARTLFQTAAMAENGVQAEFNWEHDALGNVLAQHETWPGDTTRQGGIRSTVMAYDANNRLLSETIQTRSNGSAQPVDQSTTAYTYDAANNRATKTVTRIGAPASSAEAGENGVGFWEYTYNSANQLTGWEKWDEPNGSLQKSAAVSYDDAGNRTGQTVDHISTSASDETTSYTWDAQDRLLGVTMPDGSEHSYDYDYRIRRIGTSSTTAGTSPVTKQTAIVFSGGLSVAEWEAENSAPGTANPPTVEYTRGPDMGGGVGGLLYSLRDESGAAAPKYNLSNGRGDIVAQSNQSAALTWTASYEAYGKRTKETGENQDKQRGNSKDEDPTGLLNEGFRYRDLETGVWLSRDPAGFVDGPNLYAYVMQNPWTGWDPLGLYQTTPAALLHLNGINTTSHEFQKGFQQGANKAAVVGAAMTVGVAVTVYTGGAAAPIIGKLGLGATGAFLTTAGVSGAAGGAASQMTSNALTGQPLLQNVRKAAGTGALFNMGGAVLGQTAQAFSLGLREGTAIAAAKELGKNAAASGASGGAANVMVTADGQMFGGLSKSAGGGPISEGVKNMYGSAKVTCAEARTLTAIEQAGVNPQGAMSASASVGVKGLPAGTPMKACEAPLGRGACAPVLKNAGIGDAVAGTTPMPMPTKAAVPVKPATGDEKK